MQQSFRRTPFALAPGVTTLAAALMISVALPQPGTTSFGAAMAQEGQGSAQGNQGGQGQGSKGSQSGQDNQGGQGTGQGGPDAGSDSKGPQAGTPAGTGSGGGKPIWAQEGIPEVELGRLSVARSPDQVLDRALAEALAAFTPEMVSFYNLDLATMISKFSLEWDSLTIIDSPLQNLSLLRDALDGTTDLAALGVTNDVETLMAVFIGVASDKTVPVTADTVTALSIIFEDPLSAAEAAALAADAEAVRIAVLAGHG